MIMVVNAIVPSTNDAVDIIIIGDDLISPPRPIMSNIPIQVFVSVRVIFVEGLYFLYLLIIRTPGVM